MFIFILIVAVLVLVFVLSEKYEQKIVSDFVEEHTPLSSKREIKIENDIYLIDKNRWSFASALKRMKILDHNVSAQFLSSDKREIKEIIDPAVKKFVLESKEPNHPAFGYFCKFLIDGTFGIKNKEGIIETSIIRGVEMFEVAIQSGHQEYRVPYIKAVVKNEGLFDNLINVISMLEDMASGEDDIVQEWAYETLAEIFLQDPRVETNKALSKDYRKKAKTIRNSGPEIPF